MTRDNSNIHQIFNDAILLESEDQRSTYLDQVCGDDNRIRERLEALLLAHSEAGAFFGGSPHETVQDTAAVIGQKIGPYKLLEVIGEGGMGTVYMAEQTEPVKRRVALKLIKTGMDTRQVVARFEAERQALALMDHPNIAKVHDAGATDAGRPYFVMELVKGKPITQFCDEQRLDTEARLKLFQQVCQAVQHAHQKGIIHRDLKPSNVMVAMYDDQPVPKVIDFGVAKATGDELTEQTMFTRFGQIVGTLEYMSPEQAQFNNRDIDTRSDIYSLGAILYEILAGEPPFEREKIKSQALDETLRMIREDEPTRPSTRLSGFANASRIAADRQTTSDGLGSLLKGDLDWIVIKALAKSRLTRYPTATDLSSDIQRFIDSEPVLARPPSAFYSFQKYARKHKVRMIGFVSAGLLLFLALTGLSVGNWLIRGEQTKTQIALKEANANAARTDRVLTFLESRVLAAARPKGETGGLGKDVSLREAIESALPFLAEEFEDPLVEARLRATLGTSFAMLGEFEKARSQLSIACDIRSRFLPPTDPDLLVSQKDLATIFLELGDFNRAIELFERIKTISEDSLGRNHPETLSIINNLAMTYSKIGRYADAIELGQESIERLNSQTEPDEPLRLALLNNLAVDYASIGQMELALPYFEDVLKLRKQLLPVDHPETLSSINNLGYVYANLGRSHEALEKFQEAVNLTETLLDAGHPTALAAKFNLAAALVEAGDAESALPVWQETVQGYQQNVGDDHPDALGAAAGMAECYLALGQPEEALKHADPALEICRDKVGDGHPQTLDIANAVANIKLALEQCEEAEALATKTCQLAEDTFSANHPNQLTYRRTMAKILQGREKWSAAKRIFEDVLELRISQLGDDHPSTFQSRNDLAWLTGLFLQAQEQEIADALLLAQDCIAAYPEKQEYQLTLGLLYFREGQFQLAIKALPETASDAEIVGPAPFILAMSHWELGEKQTARRVFNDASDLLQKTSFPSLDVQYLAAFADALLDDKPLPHD